MKNKIKPGQCYEYKDVIYEVIGKALLFNRNNFVNNYWEVRDVLSKKIYLFEDKQLLEWRRPYNTEG